MRKSRPLARSGPKPARSVRLRSFPGRSLVANALALLGAQGLNYIFPLILIPYLTRILGARGWGMLVFAYGFAGLLQYIVEYGFQLSATREVALHRNLPQRLATILAEVTAVKLILFLISAIIVVAFSSRLPHIGSQPLIIWSSMMWMAGQAFSMGWFYQGIEKIRQYIVAETAAGVAATIAIPVLVSGPEDAWKVLFVQGSSSITATACTHVYAFGKSALVMPGAKGVLLRFRTGANAFLYRLAVGLYSVANPLILGWMAPVSAVAYFSAGDRMVRALIIGVYPLAQALYPRVTYHTGTDNHKAQSLARIGLVLAGGIGTGCGAVAYFAAPFVVPLLFGPQFAAAVNVLQVLALLCPLIAVNTMLVYQWLLPRHLDASLRRLTLAAGAVNVTAALLLVPAYGATGMAWTVVCAEAFVLAAACFVLLRHCRRSGGMHLKQYG